MPSKYYGTLISDKGQSTRAGHRYIQAAAQTFKGSIAVMVDGADVTFWAGNGSTPDPPVLLGTFNLSDLLQPGSVLKLARAR